MLVNLSLSFLGVLVFFFIFWKRLKEDYAAEIIFTSAFFILFGILASTIITKFILHGWAFYLIIAGALIGLLISTFRFKIRFYETLEAASSGLLPWASFILLGDSVKNSSLSSFLGFLGILVLMFINYLFNINYKNFAWYKSGRIGFSGLATIGIFFLIRSTLAIFRIAMLSFVDKYEALISGVLAFVCFLVLYNLGRKI